MISTQKELLNGIKSEKVNKSLSKLVPPLETSQLSTDKKTLLSRLIKKEDYSKDNENDKNQIEFKEFIKSLHVLLFKNTSPISLEFDRVMNEKGFQVSIFKLN